MTQHVSSRLGYTGAQILRPGPPRRGAVGTRLPVAPLLRLVEGNASELARTVGVAVRTVYRWKRDGMHPLNAEWVAEQFGVHPVEMWGDAFYSAMADWCFLEATS